MIDSDYFKFLFKKRQQLMKTLEQVGLLISPENDFYNRNSNKTSCIRAVLAAGFYPNVVRIDKKNNRLINE